MEFQQIKRMIPFESFKTFYAEGENKKKTRKKHNRKSSNI